MSSANPQSQAYEVSDTAEAIEYYEKGWTDGLPVVPPTEASIRAMLDAGELEPGQEIAFIENRQISVTAEGGDQHGYGRLQAWIYASGGGGNRGHW